MTDRSGKFGNLIMTLLSLLIGSVLIYGNVVDREMGETLARMLGMPWVGAALGAVLILSVILRWVVGFRKVKPTFIDFRSEDGSVGISTKAICDFVDRVGKEFSGIKRIDSKLITEKGSVDVVLGVKVISGNKIPELSQVLQKRVRESMRESLGLGEIRNITIKVQEIVGDPARPTSEASPIGE